MDTGLIPKVQIKISWYYSMSFDPVLIPAVLSLMFQGIIGIISQVQHSRCSEIRMCGSYCKRDVLDKEEEPVQLRQ